MVWSVAVLFLYIPPTFSLFPIYLKSLELSISVCYYDTCRDHPVFHSSVPHFSSMSLLAPFN